MARQKLLVIPHGAGAVEWRVQKENPRKREFLGVLLFGLLLVAAVSLQPIEEPSHKLGYGWPVRKTAIVRTTSAVLVRAGGWTEPQVAAPAVHTPPEA